MKIATFNINGINSRLPALLEWLQRGEPKASDHAPAWIQIEAARLQGEGAGRSGISSTRAARSTPTGKQARRKTAARKK